MFCVGGLDPAWRIDHGQCEYEDIFGTQLALDLARSLLFDLDHLEVIDFEIDTP